MAKKINSSDLFSSEDIFKGIRESANRTLKDLDKMTAKLKKSAVEIQKAMSSIKFGNTAQIKQLMDLMQKVTKLQKEAQAIETMRKTTLSAQAKAEMELLTVERARNQAKQEALKTARLEASEQERISRQQEKQRKATENTKNAYNQLAANTRALKNESKMLGAEMLKLEAAGKQNTNAYEKLRAKYEQVTAAAKKGDEQLKKLDKTVGDNFRNVGNYTEAVSKFGTTLAGAFGVTVGLQGFVNLFSSMTAKFMEFEYASATVAGVLRKTTDQTMALQEQAKYLGATTAMSATQVVQLQEAYARLGFSMQEIQNMTKATIDGAVAMNSSLDRTAELTGAVVRTFGEFESIDAPEIVDKMTASTQMSALSFSKLETALPIVSGAAEAAGISFDRLLALLGKLSDAGVDASNSATSLRNIFIDAAGQGLDYNQILQKIANSTNKLSTGYDEFGKRGAIQANILAAQLDSVKDLEIAIGGAAGTAERAANNQLNTLQGRLIILESSWEGFVLSIEDGNGRIGAAMMKVVDTATEILNIWAGVAVSEQKVHEDTTKFIEQQNDATMMQLKLTREQYEANTELAMSDFERNRLTEAYAGQRQVLIDQQRLMARDAAISEKDRIEAMRRAQAINTLVQTVIALVRAFALYKIGAMAMNLYNTRISVGLTKLTAQFRLARIQTASMTTGMKVAALGTRALTLSWQGLKTAMATNPFGIILVALTELYFLLSQVEEKTQAQIEAEEKAKAAAEALRQEKEEESQAIAENTREFVALIKQIKAANFNSEERVKLINQVNQQYGTTLQNMRDENLMQQQLNAVVHEYIEYKKLQFRIQKNDSLLQKELEKQYTLEEKMNNLGKDRILNVGKLNKAQTDAMYEAAKGSSSAYTTFVNTLGKIYRDANMENSFEWKMFKKAKDEYASMNSQLQNTNEQIDKLGAGTMDLQNSLSKYKFKDPKIGGVSGEGAGGGLNKNTKETVINLKEINTEFKFMERYLRRQEELLWEIDEARQKTSIEDKEREITREYNLQKKNIQELGVFEVDKLNELIQQKADLELIYAQDKEKFELSQLERKYDLEMKERAIALAKEKQDLVNQAENIYQDNLKEAEGNNDKKKEAYDKYTKAIDEIDEKYAIRYEELDEEEQKRYADLQLEKQGVTENTSREIARINRDKVDAIKLQEEELAEDLKKIDEEKEKDALEKLKEREKAKQEFAKITADYLIKQSERVVEQLDKEIAAAEEQADTLRKLAEEGNINAQQSLAKQEDIIAEANKRKQQELRRQQQIRLAESVYTTYSSKVEAGSKNPLAETIRDTTLLQAFINSLPTYEKGTEDTGKDGRGVDGKGGMLSVLHPNERVIPKTLNEKIGNMTNEQLTKIAQEYNQNRIMSYKQQESSLEFALLINEVKDLKKAIMDKPVSNVELGEITQSALEIVQSTKKGNSVVYNRFKVRK
jgi:hypothetical protein